MQDDVWYADTSGHFILANPCACEAFALENVNNLDIQEFAASLEVLRPDGSPRPIDEAPPLRALRNEETQHFTLNTWSRDVMPACNVINAVTEYDLADTGFWGEVVRQRSQLSTIIFMRQMLIKKIRQKAMYGWKNSCLYPFFQTGKLLQLLASHIKKMIIRKPMSFKHPYSWRRSGKLLNE